MTFVREGDLVLYRRGQAVYTVVRVLLVVCGLIIANAIEGDRYTTTFWVALWGAVGLGAVTWLFWQDGKHRSRMFRKYGTRIY